LCRSDVLEDARLQAIIGSCPKSHKSVKSGLRFWRWFAVFVLREQGNILPPKLEQLLVWSRMFRCHKTFGNYLSYVKLGCEMEGACVDVFAHPSLKRAKVAIEKRRMLAPRVPTWVRLETLQKLVTMVIEKPCLRDLVMLFIASYAFLLRVPSEGIPMAAHSASAGDPTPIFSVTESAATLWFPFRKNMLWPSQQVRKCWCKNCPLTCPVHILGAYMRGLPGGSQPFAHIVPAQAVTALRELLGEAGVTNASLHRLHDFRRGHAEDLCRGGARLCEILAAGDWKSAAFLAYLDKERLEMDRVIEAQTGFSDSEEEDDG